MKSPDSPGNIVALTIGEQSGSLVHLFSTRPLGNMSVSRDNPQDVLAHRKQLCSLVEVPYERTFLIPQTHSTNILIAENDNILGNLSDVRLYNGGGKLLKTAREEPPVCQNPEWEQGIDGVILTQSDLFAMVTTADCAPVGFWDPRLGIAGIAHAGLIGAINQLPARMVRAMVRLFDSKAEEIQVSIGPCIRSCHYDLSRSGVWKSIGETTLNYYGRGNLHFERGFFDLPGLIAEQLIDVGVRPEHIHDSGVCTACEHDRLFSNFMAGDLAAKAREGRFATIMGIRAGM